jgi:hypothetical protein
MVVRLFTKPVGWNNKEKMESHVDVFVGETKFSVGDLLVSHGRLQKPLNHFAVTRFTVTCIAFVF